MARRKKKKQLSPLLLALPGVIGLGLGAAAIAWAYKLDKRSRNATQAIMNVSDYTSENANMISEIFRELEDK